MTGLRKNMEVLLTAVVLCAAFPFQATAENPTETRPNTTTPSTARLVLARSDETRTPVNTARDSNRTPTTPVGEIGPASDVAAAAPDTAGPAMRSDPTIPAPKRKKASGSGFGGKTIPAARSDTPWYRNGLFALGAVLAVIFGIVLLLRRYVPSARAMSGGPLKVVGRIHLSPKQSVALLQVGRRHVLVGITPDRLTNLGHIADPDESFSLRARTANKEHAEKDTRFDEALESEAAEYVELEVQPDFMPPAKVGRLQETMAELRSLLTRLRLLQEQGK